MDEREIKPINFKKIFIIVLALVFVIGVGVFFLNKKEAPTAPKVVTKTNEELTKDQIVDYLSINNISLVTKNGKWVFSSKLTNLTANEIKAQSLNILILDEDGKEIINLIGYFGGLLGPEETKVVTAESDIDLAKADKIEFTLNK